MKISKLFSLAALALITTACSDQIEQVQQPRNTEGIPFTATISTEGHASTRLLAESGTSITATWATGEKVALIYTVSATTYVKEAEVTPQGDGTATISTTLDGSPADDTDVTIVYPASAVDESTKDVKTDLLTSQNGLLTGTGSISEKYDLRKTSTPAKLKIDGTTASLKGTVKLAQQVSIWKLTLQKGGADVTAKTLVIKDASNNLLASATLATAGKEFYVAIPAMTSVKILAVNGDDSYSYSKASVSIEAGKYYQSTVSLNDDITNLSASATANTYLVTAAGKYKFKATVKGNGGLDPITNATATPIDKASIAGVKVLWELGDTYGKAIKYESSAYDISYLDGYVYFSTPETFQSGDAYVAIYDSSDKILWSWLIWTSEQVPSELVHNGLTFMDRNLAALNYNTNFYDYGLTYQWGRKDPFTAGTVYNSPTDYKFVPEINTAFSVNSVGTAGTTVEYTIEYPATFIYTDYPHNWMSESAFNNELWKDGVKTIYDPCPIGWRVPSKDEMVTIGSSSAYISKTGGATDWNGSRFAFANSGSEGYYNTSTSVDRSKVYMWDSDYPTQIRQDYHRYGRAIRPVKEPGPATSKSLASLTTDEIGWRIGSDGNAYSPGILPSGVTAVAMIAYVGSETGHATYNHGLALALTDESGGSTMNWSDAGSACSGKNTSTPVANATWLLASEAQWNTMITAFGGNSALRDGFSSVGGTNLHASDRYWSSSEYFNDSGDFGRTYSFYGSGTWGGSAQNNTWRARAALAF